MQKMVKWAGRIFLGILLLIILLALLVHTTPVKEFIRKRLENYLIAKTNTVVRISALNYRLPNWVELDGILLKDKTGDTLLYGNSIRLDINMWKLLQGHYTISRIALNKVVVKVTRNRFDSLFNYQFLLDAFVNKSTSPQKTPTTLLSIGEATIMGSVFSWKDAYTGITAQANIGLLNAQNLTAISTQQIALRQLKLENSFLLMSNAPLQRNSGTNKSIDTTGSHIQLTIQDLHVSNNTIVYNKNSEKRKTESFDINHVQIASLNASATEMLYTGKNSKAVITSLSMKEQSGFILDSLHGNMNISDSQISVKNLLVKTPGSRIEGSAGIFPYALQSRYTGTAQNHIILKNSILAKADIILLAPTLVEKYKKQLRGINTVYIDADMTGNARQLFVKKISLQSNRKDLYLNASGTLLNILSSTELQYDVLISKAIASKDFINPIVNMAGKQQVNLPPSITAIGKIKGNVKQLTADLLITSAYGSAYLNGQLSNFTNSAKLGYNMRLLAKDLETGKWISNDSISGKLNGTIAIKGYGTDYKTATITSAINLHSYRLENHLYTGIDFKINGNKGEYNINGIIADTLLRLNTALHVVVNKQYPSVTGSADIKNADLYQLGLYATPLRFRSMLNIKGDDFSPDGLNVFIRMDSSVIIKDKTTLKVDSLIARGVIDSGKTLLSLHTSFADIAVKGIYKYNELPDILQYYATKYFNHGTKPTMRPPTISLDMKAEIRPDPIYALLLPGLFFDKNIHANGRIDTRQKDSTLYFYLDAPLLAYKTNQVSNLRAGLNGINDAVKYLIQVDTLRASALRLYNTSLSGGINPTHFSAAFVTNDSKKKEKYSLALTGTAKNDGYLIHMANKLVLNYVNWKVDDKNNISYGPGSINISQFNISNGDEKISVNSSSTAANAPVDIKVERFSLADITALLDRDSLEIGGMLSAQVKVDGLDKNILLFDGNIKIDSLTYQKQAVGNISADAKTDNNTSVTFSGKLTGSSNKVDLKGSYDQEKVNAQLNFDPVALKSIEPFTEHNLTRSTGTVSGSINITGKPASPEWTGSIHFDSVFTQLAKYGTRLKISGQKIDLQYPVISLTSFTVKDSLDHTLTVDGTIKQEDGSFVTALTVKANDFTALDNNPVVNNQLYGKAIVDVDVTVAGPFTTPDITGNLGLKDKSEVTFVRQQTVASAKDREAVMQFVNMDTIKNLLIRPADSLIVKPRNTNNILNYSLNIDIDKNAKFNIIIDPLTRDEIQVQGTGQLSAGVSPNGDISLTGAYNLSKGSYQLNTRLLKRKFNLQEGSTIVLSGDPKNAEANIVAIYDIEASPYDLVANEISDIGNSTVYRQKIPFQVILKIKGRVIQPELVFDIQVKDKANGVNNDMSTTIDNKLLQMRTDPSSMNKQVFALLVMGRFIGEQSKDFFASGSGDGLKADQVVKESVSRFLSDAVSQIAADLIKGVDIDINLRTVDNYTDATQRTDLNLALSKRFLNDRLSINVGKNFTIDGEDPIAKGQDNGNVQFLPDVTTTYKLSKDGRYMLKAYQKSEYETILDGYFIETGIAFTVSMDYDRFKEFFMKKKK